MRLQYLLISVDKIKKVVTCNPEGFTFTLQNRYTVTVPLFQLREKMIHAVSNHK